MRAYGASVAHRSAMPHWAKWADEASAAHWEQSGAALPTRPEAVRRLREAGRPVGLRCPFAEGRLLVPADLSETVRVCGGGVVGSVHERDNGHKFGAWATASVLA